MAKDKEKEPEAPAPTTRKGRYLGTSGRRFESAPFGFELVPKHGEVVEVDDNFKYLWTDPNFAHLWEWDPK